MCTDFRAVSAMQACCTDIRADDGYGSATGCVCRPTARRAALPKPRAVVAPGTTARAQARRVGSCTSEPLRWSLLRCGLRHLCLSFLFDLVCARTSPVCAKVPATASTTVRASRTACSASSRLASRVSAGYRPAIAHSVSETRSTSMSCSCDPAGSTRCSRSKSWMRGNSICALINPLEGLLRSLMSGDAHPAVDRIVTVQCQLRMLEVLLGMSEPANVPRHVRRLGHERPCLRAAPDAARCRSHRRDGGAPQDRPQ